MKLQLYINGSLYSETHLPDADFSDAPDYNWENNVKFREQKLQEHVEEMIYSFLPKITKAERWKVILLTRSKMNDPNFKITEDEPEKLYV